MRRYLLDTGIAQDFVYDRDGIRERVDTSRKNGNRIGICTPVLGELWSGVEGSVSRIRNMQRLQHALSRLIVWPYTNESAEEFGRVFAELRRIGPPEAHRLGRSSRWASQSFGSFGTTLRRVAAQPS
jgi:tRNA(fMet)-specific endonuclease VapC